jgi:hypothetical protein
MNERWKVRPMNITADVITALATAALSVGNFIVIILIFKQIKVQNEQLRFVDV